MDKQTVLSAMKAGTPMSGNDIFSALYPEAPKDFGEEWESRFDEVQAILGRWMNIREKNADKVKVVFVDGRPKFMKQE